MRKRPTGRFSPKSDLSEGLRQHEVRKLCLSFSPVLGGDDEVASKDPKVEMVLVYIRDHCFRTFSLEEVSGSFNLSTSRLRHLVKTRTGLSVNRYIKHLRLEKARELLASTFLSVKEIMAQVGCNDLSHFIRDFKAVCGVSPTRYRLLLLQKKIERRTQDPQ